jgi:murein DD-endopeptidase MepM/ murein hydrolase activator NlpD
VTLVLARACSAAAVVALVGGLLLAAPPAAAIDAQPFIWPTSGRISQPFGCTGFVAEPRRGSCAHFHEGIDIANRRGTPIHAAADGVIEIVGWDPWIRHNPDWLVVIDHGGGFRTLYAHMRARRLPGITKGAHVVQGQVIGYMDMTGHATGPHLHWAVYLNGNPVNPAQYVNDALRRPLSRKHNSASPTVTSVSYCRRESIGLVQGSATAMVLEGDEPNAACAA